MTPPARSTLLSAPGAVSGAAPLLPPNRRVRRPKPPPPTVSAPDEKAPFDGQQPGGEGVDAGPAPQHVDPRLPRGAYATRLPVAFRSALVGIVAIAFAGACAWGLFRYTRRSPRFAIRSVQVQGIVHANADEIAKLGGIAIGANVFELDVDRARSGILQNPWVERVAISRRLPGTVRIDLVEREPAAIVSIGAQLYLATRQGEPFKRLEPGDPSDLPVITGPKPEQAVQDRAGAVAMMKRALDLAAEYERLPTAKAMAVQEVHIEEDGAFALVVGKSPVVLRMGRGPFRQPLEQAGRVLAEVASRGAQAGVVFLDNQAHPERVVVRMR